MKEQISTPVLIGIVAVVVLIIGIVSWQMFGTHTNGGSAAQVKAAKALKAKREGD